MNAEIISSFRTKMIGQILLEWGYITEEQLKKALMYQRKKNDGIAVEEGTTKRIGEILVEMNITTVEKVEVALAVQRPYLAFQERTVPSISTRTIHLIIYG